MTAPTLDDVINAWAADYARSLPEGMTPVSNAGMAALKERLLAREDSIADILRLAGVQFGLFSQIVAEVLAEVGVGTPPTEQERAYIKTQFVTLMEELRRQQEGGAGV